MTNEWLVQNCSSQSATALSIDGSEKSGRSSWSGFDDVTTDRMATTLTTRIILRLDVGFLFSHSVQMFV